MIKATELGTGESGIVTKIRVTPKTLFLINHVHCFQIYPKWSVNPNVSIILDQGDIAETNKQKSDICVEGHML